MRVFVVGASGAIGTRLVPQLIARGHEVIGTFRSPGNAERIQALGAKPIVLNLLDARAVRKAVLDSKPEVIVHQATALADLRDFKHFDRSFAQTNRLRTEGTDALLAAAREAGVRRFVAQSFASARYARGGGPVKTEDDPLDPTPVAAMRETDMNEPVKRLLCQSILPSLWLEAIRECTGPGSEALATVNHSDIRRLPARGG